MSNDQKPIFVAGHRGMAGSAIWRYLKNDQGLPVVGASSRDLDLRDANATRRFFDAERPATVVMAAARVGGILANAEAPAVFLSDNLRMQLNILDCAVDSGVERLLFLGSSCIYPKFAKQPIPESALLTGVLEPTNDAYAIAKIAGVLQVQAIRRQYDLPYISVMPTNLYGPGDNFSSRSSHVVPSLLRRIHEAKINKRDEVVVWGTGTPRREFLFVDDLAEATAFLLAEYDDPRPINVGTGTDVTICELAELICSVVGYEGRLVFDRSKPDGTPRKLLDVSRLTNLGWVYKTDLEEGLRLTYSWFLQHQGDARGMESSFEVPPAQRTVGPGCSG